MFNFLTLDHFTLKGKVVGVRLDLNSPLIKGKITLNERIKAHAYTLRKLIKMKARIVILAHQGRKGDENCISLKAHAQLLSDHLKKPIQFSDEVYSPQVLSTINSLKEGELLMLENLRFYDDETNPKKPNNMILGLEDVFDFYVQDAFSVAHRNQTSIIGFTKTPSLAGDVMEKELRGLNKIEETRSPHVYLFGGAKPDDLLDLMEVALKKGDVDIVLLTGVIGELALYSLGYYLGKKVVVLHEKGYDDALSRLKSLLKKYPEHIAVPLDVAVLKNGKRIELPLAELKNHKDLLDQYLIEDVGPLTIERYKRLMTSAGSVYVKGTPGNFEVKGADIGTKELLKAVTQLKDTFTFLGGGHSSTAAQFYGLLHKFSYVSLAGGALVRFLSGKSLIGVEILEKSFQKYTREFEDFIVVGSNVEDIQVDVPEQFAHVELGDKIKIEKDFKRTLGGGGVNVSSCLVHLGAKVGYLGKLSTQNREWVESSLTSFGIQTLTTKPTTKASSKSIILNTKDKDRVIFSFRGQNRDLVYTDFDTNTFRAKHYYFTSLSGTSFQTLNKLAKTIRKQAQDHLTQPLICYNPSSYLIENEKKVLDLVKQIDVLVLNYDEAQQLIRKEASVSQCLKALKQYISSVVVITDGKHGAYAYDGDQEYFQKAYKTTGTIYATGAGDAFAGTFSYFYVNGHGIKRAMRYAAKNAASVVSKPGALNGLLTCKEVLK